MSSKKKPGKLSSKKAVKKITRGVTRGRTKPSSNLVYQVNRGFGLYNELYSLLAKAVPQTFPNIEKELKKLGRIKLVILTGVFLNINNARVDILVVGEGIQLSKFTEFIRDLEASLGRELRYVILSRDEFIYRYEMFDRFLGDILEYPHQKIINKLKI